MAKINLTHDHEEKIVTYCAKNNKEFCVTTAYKITLETFKDEPITIQEDTESGRRDITEQVARYIESHSSVIDRISAKIVSLQNEMQAALYALNTSNAFMSSKPDLDTLVDNLYRLNIVDRDGYLALVCFLMQLKYTRNNMFKEDDKTCVFFNGVARNGKSATAKAICEVESQYGKVFRAHTGKLLGSTHEEQVWKSHLNFFDEVTPSDVDRQLSLTSANGGMVELNPKNKTPYNYRVNTNNIFTSNDQINMMQRRISVIKFGNRLNGRPLEAGTLKSIITKIMDSLPLFDRYYDIYDIVSVKNENRINPLGMEGIITYLDTVLGHVTPEKDSHLMATKIFSPHNIYSCIKSQYCKQIINSERRKAICITLEYLCKIGYLAEVKYSTTATKYYKVFGKDYLNMKEEFSRLNTNDEVNKKISKEDLKMALAPYFQPVQSEPANDPTNHELKDQKINSLST